MSVDFQTNSYKWLQLELHHPKINNFVIKVLFTRDGELVLTGERKDNTLYQLNLKPEIQKTQIEHAQISFDVAFNADINQNLHQRKGVKYKQNNKNYAKAYFVLTVFMKLLSSSFNATRKAAPCRSRSAYLFSFVYLLLLPPFFCLVFKVGFFCFI